jgi:membrane-associated protein
MDFLLTLHGATGIALLCLLLFAEEGGIPMPFLPGEGILIVAGVLITSDAFPLWLFLPMASLAVIAGALTGYAWTRMLGAGGLAALAERFHAGEALNRVQSRLSGAGPVTVAVCRLIPGLRINTSLVAGATGVEPRAFVLGLVPSAVLWVIGFTVLGVVAGVPAQSALGKVGHLATDGAILLLVAVAGYLALLHIPPVERARNAFESAPRPERLALALLVDLAIVSCLVLGIASLIRAGIGIGDIDGFVDFLAVVVVTVLGYAVASRRGTGVTGGEALFSVNYRRTGADRPGNPPHNLSPAG